MRALFHTIGLQSLLNPLLAGVCVLAIAGVAGNVWPGDRHKAVLAALLMATSTQVLIVSMTAYAMSAHLALNLVWLWLYSRPQSRLFWLTPWVGALALGLHQPFFHALFATPFLLRLALQRRWKACAWFIAVYGCAIVCWAAWWFAWVPNFGGGAASAFAFDPLRMLGTQGMSFALILSWQSAAAPLLVFLALRSWKGQPTLIRDAVWSCALTFAFYAFTAWGQGHGWGYRYMHGALGCLFLVAAAGWSPLRDLLGKRRAVGLIGAALLLTLVVQLPMRAIQVESIVRPYAEAIRMIEAQPVEAVVIDHAQGWYAADLVRNEPFLQNSPKKLFLRRLTFETSQQLDAMGEVRAVTGMDLAKSGMPAWDLNFPREPARP